MKTLVIHPDDRSTDFLKLIYEGKGFDVINDGSINKEELISEIESHDRIIMMGHGTPSGLLNPQAYYSGRNILEPLTSYRSLYLIDKSIVPYLRDKETISIWCYSAHFFLTNRLFNEKKTLHTDMIISEVTEANYVLGYSSLNKDELLENMNSFAIAVRNSLDLYGIEMENKIKEAYVGDDDITKFNRDSILTF